MKAYIDQVFYEGLGKSIYCPIENKLNKIKNEKIKRVLIGTVKVVYFIIAVSLAFMIFYFK